MSGESTEATMDRELFDRMQEPHESIDAARKALAAFNADVREARARHRIAHVTTIASLNYPEGDGVTSAASIGYCGSFDQHTHCIAIAYRQEVAPLVARLAATGPVAPIPKRSRSRKVPR